MSSIVIATSTANVTHRGARVHVQAGSAWDGADSLVAAFPALFTDDARALQRTDELPVEAATAAPGEKRQLVGASSRSRKA